MIEAILQNAATLFKEQLTIAFKGKTLPVSILQHGGQFGDGEIEKISISQPSILLTVMNWSRMASSKQLTGRPYLVNFAAVIVAVDGEPVMRRAQCVELGTALSRLLENQRWGINDSKIGAADLTASRNLYSAAAQKKGMSLWAVTWSQELSIIGEVAMPTLYRLQEMQMESNIHGSINDTPEIEGSTMAEYGDLNPEPET